MNKALIKLSYRQIINAHSNSTFEKAVFDASYSEFLLKSQAYNPEGKIKTFTELKANDGRANSLHYKSGFAIAGFMETLNKTIPGLQNSSGQNILFDTYKFEVIESDITDKAAHHVAIIYYTDIYTLLDVIGDNLLLVTGDKSENLRQPQTFIEETFLMKLIPQLSISAYSTL